MGQYMANIDFPSVEMHRGYQTIFVPTDIEYDQVIDRVCSRKSRLKFVKILKICCLHNFEPSQKRSLTIRMFFPKVLQCFPTDNMHQPQLSHIEIIFNS